MPSSESKSASRTKGASLLSVALGELSASCIDIVAARVSHSSFNANTRKGPDKHVSLFGGGRLEARALKVVQLDEVNVSKRATGEVAQGIKLVHVVVDTADEGVLIRRAAASPVDILEHDVVKMAKRVLLDARHERVARCLDGRVERHGKGELLGLSREPPDHRDDATGGYREVASSDASSLRGVQHAQRLERLLIIVEGLTLSHHHDARGSGLEIFADMNDLVVHLGGRK